MPDFSYFGTWNDSVEVFKGILAHDRIGIVTSPGLRDDPQVRPQSSWSEDLAAQIRREGQVYLTGPFTRSRLGVIQFGDGPQKGKDDIDPSHGGPVLVLSWAPGDRVGAMLDLGPGSLWYQPRYKNLESGEWGPPPTDLKEAFTGLTRVLKSRLERLELSPGSFVYAGPEAAESYRSSKAVIHWKGKKFGPLTSPAT